MNPPRLLPRIHLIRHGETLWSLSGQHTSRTEIPLTAHGEEQALQLGARLREINFSRVFTSPYLRARQTCALAGRAASAEVEPDLREWDYGDYEGRTSTDIRATCAGWDLFIDGAAGGETPAQVCARAERFVCRLRQMEGDIAVFSHGHFLRVLATLWIALPVTAARHFLLGTASLSILGYEHNPAQEPAIILWNATAKDLFDIVPSRSVGDRREIERWENEGGEIPPQKRASSNSFESVAIQATVGGLPTVKKY